MSSSSTPIRKRILVTGGCGYIGSHTLVSLLSQQTSNNIEYSVVVVDNLANSSPESLRRVADITNLEGFTINDTDTAGEDTNGRLIFRNVDCCNEGALRSVFEEFASQGGFDAAVHFAGLKAVGESKLIPLKYCE